PPQSDHAGAGLSAARKRDLLVRPAAFGSGSVPGGGGRSAGRVHGSFRAGDHRLPHQPGVRLDQHRTPDEPEGRAMIYLLVLFPLGMAAAIYLVPSNRWRP